MSPSASGETRALVLASGDPDITVQPPPHDIVIAADSGLDLAEAMGLEVALVVGDMDSVSAGALARAEKRGVSIERHPTAKDMTDLELAMAAALRSCPASIHVIVGSGGRVDHAIANLMVLASPRWEATRVTATVGESRLWVIHDSAVLDLRPGEPLSLLPIGGPAAGLRTSGLEWELRDDILSPWAAKGVSNVVKSSPVKISVGGGVVVAISSPTPASDPVAARG